MLTTSPKLKIEILLVVSCKIKNKYYEQLRHLLTSNQFVEEYVEIHIPKKCGALQTRRREVKEHQKNKGGRFTRGKKTIALDLASNSTCEVNIKKP